LPTLWKIGFPSLSKLSPGTPPKDGFKSQECITVFNVDAEFGECRQATIPKRYEFLFVTFGLLNKGSCYQKGFTDPVSIETANFFFGDVNMKLYKKSPVLTPASQLQLALHRRSIHSGMLIGLAACSSCVLLAVLLGFFRRGSVTACGEPLLQ
jgi:hypothetical protein